ncbi:MAG TPA: chitinase [Polyangia bacterium]
MSRTFPASLFLACLGACEGSISRDSQPSGGAGSSTGEAGTAGAAGRTGTGGTPAGAAGDGDETGAAGSAGEPGADAAAGTTDAAGATGAAGASVPSSFPTRFVAPYVETWNNASLTDLATATGNKFYTLAFVIGSNGCTPAWNGSKSVAGDTYWANQISNLRKAGGDVLVSFGGEAGVELGDACKTVETAQAAYQSVITKYKLTWIDLDIESGAEKNTTDIDRRNKALKNLQTVNPGLRISYTLAVAPSGLPTADRNLLANAKTNGVRVDTVNIMAMDYGSCNIDMGNAAIMAATATHGQIQTLGMTSLVGVTPMIGVNDTSCENFTTANASALMTFAQDNAFINLLAFWAISADRNHSYLNIFKALH